MKYIRPILILLLGLSPGALRAQYIGLNRPQTAAQVAEHIEDSLAAPHVKIDSLDQDVDTLKSIWQHAGKGGAETTTTLTVGFVTRMPYGPADSALTDSTHHVQARHLWAMVDTLQSIWVKAGEIISPGHFYAATDSGYYHKADPAAEELAVGVGMDSVAAGSIFRLQTAGTVQFEWYRGLIMANKGVVNDSVTAGVPAPSDSTRTNTKLMQFLGLALSDSISIRLDIDPGAWIYRGN